MKKNKRIVLVIAAMLVLAMTVALLVSCTSYYTFDEAYDRLQNAIKESIKKDNYFNSIKYVNGDYEQKIRFQIIPEDEKTDAHEIMIQFAVITTPSYGAASIEEYYRYGYSLSKDIKKSKAKPEDYKAYRFFNSTKIVNNDKDKKQIIFAEESTVEKFMSTEVTGLFNPETKENSSSVKFTDMATEGLLRELSLIQKESIKFVKNRNENNSFSKTGNVDTFLFKVEQEGSKYNGLDLEVQILNDKVNTIRYTQSNGIKVQIDLIYNSPKLQLPAYDGENTKPYSELPNYR